MSTTPLRVCIDARLGSGISGGVEQVVIGLAAALSRLPSDGEEYLFLTHPETDEWLAPYVSGPCSLLPVRRSYFERRARGAARMSLERLPRVGPRFGLQASDGTAERAGADVIHFPFQDAFTTKLPSIYQPHDLQHLHLPELFPDWLRARRELVYRTHCRRAETVVTMTSWGQRDLLEHYHLAPEKVSVVGGGSILSYYPAPSPEDLRALGERIGFPQGFLLYPARAWPHKNHERLLRALALVRDREGAAPPLVCSGKVTPEIEQIESLARELGVAESVKFIGFVSPLELRGLYELATALVFPSRFEGWGLPVCEAFSAGIPVAASNATGLPDLVADAGLLFDPGDTEEMAGAISRVWTEPRLREELADRGRERSRTLTLERMARLFRAHYRRVTGREISAEDRILLAEPSPV